MEKRWTKAGSRTFFMPGFILLILQIILSIL